MPNSPSNPPAPRLAHGFALAALVPYMAMLATLAISFRGAQAEERAMLKFVAAFVVIVGYPLMLMICLAVFGAAYVIQRRSGRHGLWPYVLWGAGGAVVFLFVLWFGGPRSPFAADDFAGLLACVVTGGLAGAAFRAGAITAPRAPTAARPPRP